MKCLYDIFYLINSDIVTSKLIKHYHQSNKAYNKLQAHLDLIVTFKRRLIQLSVHSSLVDYVPANCDAIETIVLV